MIVRKKAYPIGISQQILEDSRVSLAAKGLYCVLAYLETEFDEPPSLISIGKVSNKDATFTEVSNAISELEKYGYISVDNEPIREVG